MKIETKTIIMVLFLLFVGAVIGSFVAKGYCNCICNCITAEIDGYECDGGPCG